MNGVDKAHKQARRLPLVSVLVVLLCAPAFGITLEQYKAKIDAARSLASKAEMAQSTPDSGQAPVEELVNYITESFPVSESVDWYGGTVETSNEWLLEKTRALEKESVSAKRHPILMEIREYLSATSFKLRELEEKAVAERTKDEDKQKLAEILRREEYQKPEPQGESAFQQWLHKILQSLEGLFPKSSGSPSFSGFPALASILQVLLIVGAIALLLFLVIKLVPLVFPHMKRVRKPKKKERVILGEAIAENATARDLFDEAEGLAREGKMRDAIRKGYVALLCDLSDRKVIGLARNKTNRDYLRDVRSRRELHPLMRSVTDIFERHWYGSQRSDAEDWARFREEYKRAIHSV